MRTIVMTRPEYSVSSDGVSLADLQKMPEEQRHLVNWIRRQTSCTLLDIALHLCQDEETTLSQLTPLLHQGFVQEVEADPDALYRVKIAPKRGQPTVGKLLKKKSIDTEHPE